MRVSKDENRFARLAPESATEPGTRGTVVHLPLRTLAAEHQRQRAHWTHRFPAWLERNLKRWFYRPHM